MPSSYCSLLYHIVFGTKFRKPILDDSVREMTWNYIAGSITSKKGKALQIGGTADHIHILTSCSPTMALADLIRDIKANSSRWLHDEQRILDFQWQTGYGAFTVSYSRLETVQSYVCNQAQHHHKKSFEQEYRQLLKRCGISFEEKYLFEQEHHG